MIESTLDGLDHFATWHSDAAAVILIAFPVAMLAAYVLGRAFAARDVLRARAAREDAAAMLNRVAATNGEARSVLADAKARQAETADHLAAVRAHLKDAHAILERRAATIGVKEGDPIPDWAIAWAAQAWTTPANASKTVDPSLAVDFARMLVEAAVAGPPANLITPKGEGS